MIEMRALIDDRRSFDRIMYYYQMFSFDTSYNGDDILIQPSHITRVSTRSIVGLLRALALFGQRGEKNFVIATHGNPHGLPIRIRSSNGATMNSDFMASLTRAVSGNAATRRRGRDEAMSYAAGGADVFGNERQLDELLELVQDVRQQRLGRLEFRGCNIGAGPALRSLHELLGAEITVGPTVQFIWARLSTAHIRTIDAARFEELVATMPPNRRRFTRVDCYRASTEANDDGVAIALDGDQIRLAARSPDMIKGWTQAYLQQPTLFALGREPPGGGYRAGHYLPFVGFSTTNGPLPFVVPGDAFAYSQYLASQMQPARWVPL